MGTSLLPGAPKKPRAETISPKTGLSFFELSHFMGIHDFLMQHLKILSSFYWGLFDYRLEESPLIQVIKQRNKDLKG